MLQKGSSSCYTSGTRRVNLVTNPVISHERGMDREVIKVNNVILDAVSIRHTHDQILAIIASKINGIYYTIIASI